MKVPVATSPNDILTRYFHKQSINNLFRCQNANTATSCSVTSADSNDDCTSIPLSGTSISLDGNAYYSVTLDTDS